MAQKQLRNTDKAFVFFSGVAAELALEDISDYIQTAFMNEVGPVVVIGGSKLDRQKLTSLLMTRNPTYLFTINVGCKTIRSMKTDLYKIAETYNFKDGLDYNNINELMKAVYLQFKDWPTLYVLHDGDPQQEEIITFINILKNSPKNNVIITYDKTMPKGTLNILNYELFKLRANNDQANLDGHFDFIRHPNYTTIPNPIKFSPDLGANINMESVENRGKTPDDYSSISVENDYFSLEMSN